MEYWRAGERDCPPLITLLVSMDTVLALKGDGSVFGRAYFPLSLVIQALRLLALH